jgi:glycosyltransferase involved in cell wall biosynthesis
METPAAATDGAARGIRVAHLTTVASSLRFLLLPQLRAVRDLPGGEAIGISADGDDVDFLEDDGITHVPLGSSTRSMNPLADLKAAWELWQILKRERVDVLHTHNPKPGLYGRVVGRLAGVPIVVNTNHGLYVTENHKPWQRGVVLAMEALAARFSHFELLQNPEDVELMLRTRVNVRRRTKLLGNGIDLHRFRPGGVPEEVRAARRAEWAATSDKIVVGMVGRLVVEKGFRELFAAARTLHERHPGRYVVVAVGPDDPEKADAITPAEMKAAEAVGVVFLGHRLDVEALYAAMDVFVLPSYREGFPRAAMEAAASGLPIVATDVRGCRQVVDHDRTGLLVPVRDGAALAEAILALGEDPDRREAMGKAATQRAQEHFDERKVVRIVLDTYREVAARQGRHDLVAALRG